MVKANLDETGARAVVLFMATMVEEWEVKDVTFTMDDMKAPGVVRVLTFFYQNQWQVIRERVYNFVKKMFNHEVWPKNWNKNILVLIPKP